MKRVISVQIHPNRIPKINPEKIICLFYLICRNSKEIQGIKIEANLRRPQYININYKTNDAKKTWKRIQEEVFNIRRIGALIKLSSIVVCEGKKSWQDYLLLNHFDVKQKVDLL